MMLPDMGFFKEIKQSDSQALRKKEGWDEIMDYCSIPWLSAHSLCTEFEGISENTAVLNKYMQFPSRVSPTCASNYIIGNEL